MGSSGRKELLLEAVKAIATLPQERFRAVILAPKAVCPVEEVIPLVSGRPGVLVTERFVPARLVNAMAGVAVIHGGQGTVQTAVASGRPAVGVAMQPEQQINLEHIARRGPPSVSPLRGGTAEPSMPPYAPSRRKIPIRRTPPVWRAKCRRRTAAPRPPKRSGGFCLIGLSPVEQRNRAESRESAFRSVLLRIQIA